MHRILQWQILKIFMRNNTFMFIINLQAQYSLFIYVILLYLVNKNLEFCTFAFRTLIYYNLKILIKKK